MAHVGGGARPGAAVRLLEPSCCRQLCWVLAMPSASPAGRFPGVKLDNAIENFCCLLPLLGLFWFGFFGFFGLFFFLRVVGRGGYFPVGELGIIFFCSNKGKKTFSM